MKKIICRAAAFTLFLSVSALAFADEVTTPAQTVVAENDKALQKNRLGLQFKDDLDSAIKAGVTPKIYNEYATNALPNGELAILCADFYKKYTGKDVYSTAKAPFTAFEITPFLVGAYELGMINAEIGKEYNRSAPLKRAEAARILYNTLIASGIDLQKAQVKDCVIYDDILNIPPEYSTCVNALASYFIFDAIDGKFMPDEYLTYEQAASAMLRLNSTFMRQPVSVNGKKISMGQSADKLIEDFGQPDRIDKLAYDFERYVYSSDLANLLIVGISNGSAAEVFTTAKDFKYKDIAYGCDMASLKGIISDDGENLVARLSDPYLNISVTYDEEENKSVGAIYLTDKITNIGSRNRYSDLFKDGVSLELLDCINSFRAKNGNSALIMDKKARVSTQKHAQYMKNNNYIGYDNTVDGNFLMRLKKDEIEYKEAAAVVGYGYGDLAEAYAGITSNAAKRANLQSPNLTNAGVGVDFNGLHIYMSVDLYNKPVIEEPTAKTAGEK